MSVAQRKSKAAKAAPPRAFKRGPNPALKAQLEASIQEHGFVTAKARGHLVVCEQHVLTDLSGKIQEAIRPLSQFFVSDLKGVSGALFHLKQSLQNETDTALIEWCIRVLDSKVDVISTARDDCLAAVRVSLHPEWHAGDTSYVELSA